MADSLDEAIAEAIGGDLTAVSRVRVEEDRTLDELLDQTIEHYNSAKAYLEQGDLENYGREMKIVDSLMAQLQTNIEP